MKDTDLIAELRHLKINTKSLSCLGCSYENGCSTKDCRLIGLAADRLAAYAHAVDTIKEMHTAASGVGKSLLRDVLSIFDIWYEPAQEQPRMVCDFERCEAIALTSTLRAINDSRYDVISVTHDAGVYTIFFRRPAQD